MRVHEITTTLYALLRTSITCSYANVRSVRAGPTRCPFHTFKQRRPTQRCHRHYSACFGQDMRRIRLRPHTAMNTNHTCQTQAHMQQAMQTYALVRQGPTRHPFHTFNEQRSTQSRHRHWIAHDEDEIMTSYTAMHQMPRAASSSSTHTVTQTYELFVKSQHDARF